MLHHCGPPMGSGSKVVIRKSAFVGLAMETYLFVMPLPSGTYSGGTLHLPALPRCKLSSLLCSKVGPVSRIWLAMDSLHGHNQETGCRKQPQKTSGALFTRPVDQEARTCLGPQIPSKIIAGSFGSIFSWMSNCTASESQENVLVAYKVLGIKAPVITVGISNGSSNLMQTSPVGLRSKSKSPSRKTVWLAGRNIITEYRTLRPLDLPRRIRGRPLVELLRTSKGVGVAFCAHQRSIEQDIELTINTFLLIAL